MADQIKLNRTSLPLPYQLQAKRKGSGVRTWFVVSKLGNSRIEELGKQAIMLRSGVQAHDLRVVESELLNPSAILRRERAIVVNLEHIKAIITANEVLVPNPKDPFMGSFVCDLEFKLSDFGATMVSNKAMEQSPSNTPPDASDRSPKSPAEWSNRGNSKPLPFEFRAFEICLESVCRSLESETSTLEEEAYPALDELSAKTSTHNLKHVRVIKGRLVALSGRVQKVRDEFEHLLDDDLDMSQMYLTDKLASLQSEGLEVELENDANAFKSGNDSDEDMSSKKSSIDVSDLKPNVEELEMLLGAYFVQIEGILNKLSTLREYIHNTEDYINIVLDDKQNQLLRMGIIITTGALMFNLGVVAAGFLSINIHIPLFDSGTFAPWFGAAGVNGRVEKDAGLFVVTRFGIKVAMASIEWNWHVELVKKVFVVKGMDGLVFGWVVVVMCLIDGYVDGQNDFMVEDLDKKVASPKKSQTIPCFANLGEGSSSGVLDVDFEKVAFFGLKLSEYNSMLDEHPLVAPNLEVQPITSDPSEVASLPMPSPVS
ncbi:hypothetical protein TEA_010232 [Camellia sinensis var. sinensis]|uniref:Magnesium transporter n=1 Tax=Camellia sinensis var. sinensis TaxID=542762 RepID=A0A4S4EK92_CAMSN|nr:hypothetical protein TEA_010232 [Camellia sinensis var. sinensis]